MSSLSEDDVMCFGFSGALGFPLLRYGFFMIHLDVGTGVVSSNAAGSVGCTAAWGVGWCGDGCASGS